MHDDLSLDAMHLMPGLRQQQQQQQQPCWTQPYRFRKYYHSMLNYTVVLLLDKKIFNSYSMIILTDLSS